MSLVKISETEELKNLDSPGKDKHRSSNKNRSSSSRSLLSGSSHHSRSGKGSKRDKHDDDDASYVSGRSTKSSSHSKSGKSSKRDNNKYDDDDSHISGVSRSNKKSSSSSKSGSSSKRDKHDDDDATSQSTKSSSRSKLDKNDEDDSSLLGSPRSKKSSSSHNKGSSNSSSKPSSSGGGGGGKSNSKQQKSESDLELHNMLLRYQLFAAQQENAKLSQAHTETLAVKDAEFSQLKAQYEKIKKLQAETGNIEVLRFENNKLLQQVHAWREDHDKLQKANVYNKDQLQSLQRERDLLTVELKKRVASEEAMKIKLEAFQEEHTQRGKILDAVLSKTKKQVEELDQQNDALRRSVEYLQSQVLFKPFTLGLT